MNRYQQAAIDAHRQIEEIEARIERFKARGVRLSSIPAMKQEIAGLRKVIPVLRGTAKICRDIYGETK